MRCWRAARPDGRGQFAFARQVANLTMRGVERRAAITHNTGFGRVVPTGDSCRVVTTETRMASTLAALHRLQEIETQLADLKGRIEARWRQVRAHEKRLAQIDAEIASDHAAV